MNVLDQKRQEAQKLDAERDRLYARSNQVLARIKAHREANEFDAEKTAGNEWRMVNSELLKTSRRLEEVDASLMSQLLGPEVIVNKGGWCLLPSFLLGVVVGDMLSNAKSCKHAGSSGSRGSKAPQHPARCSDQTQPLLVSMRKYRRKQRTHAWMSICQENTCS